MSIDFSNTNTIELDNDYTNNVLITILNGKTLKIYKRFINNSDIINNGTIEISTLNISISNLILNNDIYNDLDEINNKIISHFSNNEINTENLTSFNNGNFLNNGNLTNNGSIILKNEGAVSFSWITQFPDNFSALKPWTKTDNTPTTFIITKTYNIKSTIDNKKNFSNSSTATITNDNGIILNNSRFENLNNSITIKNLLNNGLIDIVNKNSEYLSRINTENLFKIHRFFSLNIKNTNKDTFDFFQLSKNYKFILKNDADSNIEYLLLDYKNGQLQNINLDNYKKNKTNEFINDIIIYDCRNLLKYKSPDITIYFTSQLIL